MGVPISRIYILWQVVFQDFPPSIAPLPPTSFPLNSEKKHPYSMSPTCFTMMVAYWGMTMSCPVIEQYLICSCLLCRMTVGCSNLWFCFLIYLSLNSDIWEHTNFSCVNGKYFGMNLNFTSAFFNSSKVHTVVFSTLNLTTDLEQLKVESKPDKRPKPESKLCELYEM